MEQEVVVRMDVDSRGGVMFIEHSPGRWRPLLRGDGDYVIMTPELVNDPRARTIIGGVARAMRGGELKTIGGRRKGEDNWSTGTQTG